MKMGSNVVFVGGIEGGATHSTLVLVRCSDGKVLSKIKGESTNHWSIGMDECQRRVAEMVNKAKLEAGIPIDQPLAALGLSLSGCEQDETNRQLEENIKNAHPNLAKKYVVCSDTAGSLATAEADGGVVLISGTGSNALLINPDGSKFQCGGWGHLLGDEGSAWWISFRAVKICFDHIDNLIKSPHSIDRVWQSIKDYFNVEDQSDVLTHCYKNFNKTQFAGLCIHLVKLAKDGDKLSQYLFREAGKSLARAIQALYPNAHETLLSREGGLHVVCVGSVWLSFDLMEEGFVTQMKSKPEIKELSLMMLTAPGAVGSCYLAADSINSPLPKHYKDNYRVVYNYKSCGC